MQDKNDYLEDSFSLDDIKVEKKEMALNNKSKVDLSKYQYIIDDKKDYFKKYSIDKKKLILISVLLIFGIIFLLNLVKDKVANDNIKNVNEDVILNTDVLNSTIFNKNAIEQEAINNIFIPNLEQFENLRLNYNNNPDIVGYISIFGTNINSPIVQYSNNTYYQDHDVYQNPSVDGTIYFDASSNLDKFSENTVIYGRADIPNEQFYDLSLYENEEFYNNNRFINLDTIYSNSVWEVVSFYSNNEDNFEVKTSFIDDEFDTYVASVKNMSTYDDKVELDTYDKILTLTTVNGNKKYVLQAKLHKISY